jgi:hypothetical protein
MKFKLTVSSNFVIDADSLVDAHAKLRDYFGSLVSHPVIKARPNPYHKLKVEPVEPMLTRQEDDG